MASWKMRRVAHTERDAMRRLEEIRQQLSLEADIVSPRSRQLTEKVFGEALPPSRVVERVCQDVKRRGTAAVLHYTEQFDQVKLTPQTLRVSAKEIDAAHQQTDRDFLAMIRRVRQNIIRFQSGLVQREAVLTQAGKYELKMRYQPMKRVGVCVPGGAASYPSTLLMTVCPARAAGVEEIAAVMPPTSGGAGNPLLLAVCKELGVDEVYRVGGAQAVAALAYGTPEIPAVDMIVGPGNLFVTLAKKFVFGRVAIDCLAGPSEVIVIADATANPAFIAADLIAQAEHDPASSLLITWHEPLLDAVETEIQRQCARLARGQQALSCLERFGALALTRDAGQAVEWTNLIAPEHLHIMTEQADKLAEKIHSAGAVFVGPHTPVALGDYAAGPSHVLPTGGTGRFASGLSACDFLRRSSLLSFTQRGLEEIAPDVVMLAEKEGLTGHAASVKIRMQK
ncbi:MAG: histidinol dehydrogenase [Gemmataceae bacterium]